MNMPSKSRNDCESCERLERENEQLRDAVTIWQKLADERKERIEAQAERLSARSEKAKPEPVECVQYGDVLIPRDDKTSEPLSSNLASALRQEAALMVAPEVSVQVRHILDVARTLMLEAANRLDSIPSAIAQTVVMAKVENELRLDEIVAWRQRNIEMLGDARYQNHQDQRILKLTIGICNMAVCYLSAQPQEWVETGKSMTTAGEVSVGYFRRSEGTKAQSNDIYDEVDLRTNVAKSRT